MEQRNGDENLENKVMREKRIKGKRERETWRVEMEQQYNTLRK